MDQREEGDQKEVKILWDNSFAEWTYIANALADAKEKVEEFLAATPEVTPATCDLCVE